MKATNREKRILSDSIIEDRLEIVRLKADLDEAVGLLRVVGEPCEGPESDAWWKQLDAFLARVGKAAEKDAGGGG